MLREIVFLDALQAGVVNVEVVAGAQNCARIGRLHFQKHFIVVNQDGAGFGGAIVNHDGDLGALDIGREAVKTLRGAIEFSESAVQCHRAVVLTRSRKRPEAGGENESAKRKCQYETFYDQIISPAEWPVR